ncbi:MAG: neutral zinc metallopeptidase [Muribaculaceae bacterium]|nr:neutral zinc metallopeptidase [Muribaculaceae bacterium]
MKLDGRRNSSNVSDRRGVSGRAVGVGGGILAVIVGAIITLMSGGNIGDVVTNVIGSGQLSGLTEQSATPSSESPEEQRLYDLASKVLAGTEDVWSREFKRQGWGTYQPPKMVIYHGSVQTGCGRGTAQTGPFYCSADKTIYLDLDFFKNMRRDIGADGDYTYAYVIAHEVGHHVQNELGILSEAHEKMARLPETEANQISVRIELQADYLAGVWGYNDNEMFGSLEPGDVENALNAASKIGDDYLQKKAYGREMPESFNHGRSSQRVRWFSRGMESGDPTAWSTWTQPYSQL